MSFNIAGLINNITGSVKNLGAQLGFTDPANITPYDEKILGEIKTQFKDSNWNKLPLPYTLSVTNLQTGLSNTSFKDFELPISPQEIQQTEEFAIAIKPTQGGTVVSHNGNRYKKLRISGTTGISPFRGVGGVDKFTGEAIFQPRNMKFQSGYHTFHELRNYIKAYYEYKKKYSELSGCKNTRLIFKNYKDGEFLIVEVLSFEMKRSAPKSFLYDYTIEFKVLKHFTFSKPGLSILGKVDEILNRSMAKIDTAKGIFLRSSNIIKQVESTYETALLEPIRKITLALKAGLGVAMDLADCPGNLWKSTIAAKDALGYIKNMGFAIDLLKQRRVTNDSKDQIMARTKLPQDPEALVARKGVAALSDLGEGMMLIDTGDLPESTQIGLLSEIENAQNLPRSFYEETLNEILRIKSNAEDLFNLGSPDYDLIFDRTSTIEFDETKEITNAEMDLLSAFNLIVSAITDIMSTSTLFKSNFDDQISSLLTNFDTGELPLQTTSAVTQYVIPAKKDIERIALEQLGDSGRWPEIAELNGLKAPYITQDLSNTSSNVAKPGDSILIPAPIIFGFSEIQTSKSIPSTVNLSELEKSLGTDFKLTNNFDLAIGNNGDIQVVSGGDNMAQAVVLKLAYEKGELIKHPSLGSGLIIGTKFKPIDEYRDDIIRTLTQDNRVERILNLALLRESQSLSLSFEVKIKNIDIPVPVIIKL